MFKSFFVFFVIRIDKVNPFQSSSFVELLFFFCPFLFLPILSYITNFRPNFWPYRFRRELNSPLQTCILLKKVSFSIEWLLWTCPRIWQMSARIHVPTILNTLFLHHIQISMRRPNCNNVCQWSRECFFFRHVELNSKFNVMTTNEVTLCRQEVFSGFSVVFEFCRLRLFRFSLKFSTEIFTRSGLFLWVGSRCLFPTILLLHPRLGIWILLPSELATLLLHWFFEDKFLRRQSFLVPSVSAIRMSPFQIPPAINACPRNISGKTFLPNWCVLDWSRIEIGWHSPLLERNYWSFAWFSDSSFVVSLPICQEVSDVSQIAIAFHGVSPAIFHQILIVAVRLKFRLSLFVQLFQQYYPSQNDECVEVRSTQKTSQRFAKFQGIVSVNDIWAFPSARRTFVNSFSVSREVFVLHG